jgi:hypothetical protein
LHRKKNPFCMEKSFFERETFPLQISRQGNISFFREIPAGLLCLGSRTFLLLSRDLGKLRL